MKPTPRPLAGDRLLYSYEVSNPKADSVLTLEPADKSDYEELMKADRVELEIVNGVKRQFRIRVLPDSWTFATRTSTVTLPAGTLVLERIT
jgi:hypothetical protein